MRLLPRCRMLLLALLLSGCNTCLDPASVRLVDDQPDTRADATHDGGDDVDAGPLADMTSTDVADDVSSADTGIDADACVPPTARELCANADRVCGELQTLDACGLQRQEECGRCDADSATCMQGRCACRDGYEPGEDPRTCDDVDECARGLDDCAPGTNCTNLPGSFQCSTCPSGFLDVNGDGTVCEDIDECANGTAACDPVVQCTNLDGSYECGDCPAGYDDVAGDGTDCRDIDECADPNANDCDPDATCTNSPGSFDCACNDGFSGDGRACVDVDECASDPCDPDATCTNSPGSFECTCDDGFVGDGFTCDAVPLVRRVVTYKASLGVDAQQFDLALNESWDVDQTVPFTTLSTRNGTGDAVSVDVYLTAPDTLRLERGAAGAEVDLNVTLVQFDPQAATVQSGAYSLPGTTTSEVLTPVDLTRTFAYHSVQTTQSEDDMDRMMVEARLDVTQIVLRRDDGSGSSKGHYWVVQSELNHFETRQVRQTITALGGCNTENIAAVNQAKTLLLWSNQYPHGAGNTRDAHIGCGFTSNTELVCCHTTASGNNIPATVFVIQFDDQSAGAVEADYTQFNTESQTVALGMSPGPSTMPLAGSSGNFGAISAGPALNQVTASGYATFNLAGNMLEITRGSGVGAAFVWWQVVHWPD